MATVIAIEALAKIWHPQATLTALQEQLSVSGSALQAVFVGLVMLELGLAGWIASGRYLRAASIVTIALMVVFTIHLTDLIWHKPQASCGCGLSLSEWPVVGKWLGVARNLAISIALMVGIGRSTGASTILKEAAHAVEQSDSKTGYESLGGSSCNRNASAGSSLGMG